jgi:hypothetical protein
VVKEIQDQGPLIYWDTGDVRVSGLYRDVVENGWVRSGILGYWRSIFSD